MNGYEYGFTDPEAAHESRLHYKLNQVKKFFSGNRIARVYFFLSLLVSIIYVLRGVVPAELSGNGGMLELGNFRQEYTMLQMYTPYQTILQSRELVAKFNHGTTIEKVTHPSRDDISLEAIRFRKELGKLVKEMEKTMHEQSFSCIPAIALGVPYNIFMDRHGKIYLNLQIVQIPNKQQNRSIPLSGLFDVNVPPHEELLYEQVQITYVDANGFLTYIGENMEDHFDSFCLQAYLKNFPFDSPMITTKEEL